MCGREIKFEEVRCGELLKWECVTGRIRAFCGINIQVMWRSDSSCLGDGYENMHTKEFN